eukprot:scaffold44462_cov29-Phaeocystis_antarctica.AAC.1
MKTGPLPLGSRNSTEFYGACAAVAARRAECERVPEHLAALSSTEAEGRRHLVRVSGQGQGQGWMRATSMSFCLRYLLWLYLLSMPILTMRHLDELLPAPLYRAVTL